MGTSTKRKITADDLYKFRIITGFDVSPDGLQVIYSLQHIEAKTQKKLSNLWIVPTGKGRARQFTYGSQVDMMPQWSPDGKEIAFLSNRENNGQFQVYIIPVQGGEARPLTRFKGSIGSLQWSPDSSKLACTFRKKDAELLEMEEDEDKKKLGVISRSVTRSFYKRNGEGFLPRERWHLWTIDTRSGKTVQLTGDDVHDEYFPSWSPDGKWITFCSNRSECPDDDPFKVDVCIVPGKGGKIRELDCPPGFKVFPSFSPDSRSIAYYAIDGRKPGWANIGLWLAAANGKIPPSNLTHRFDVHSLLGIAADLKGYPESTPPTWSLDGKRIFFAIGRHGNNFISSISIDEKDNTPQRVVEEKGTAGLFRFDEKQEKLVYFHAGLKNPGQLMMKNMKTGKTRQLTSVNDRLLRAKKLGQTEEIWIKSKSGAQIQGWIVKPPDFNSRKKYPAILEIHGGPYLQYGNAFMHEFYFLAAQGYVVFYCNPRGSQGYGEQHARELHNNWGNVAYEDLISWTEYISKKQFIDKNNMGVTGGSYGGYMTNWIIGHTSRFKAAVTQRSVSYLTGMYGSSDFNWLAQMNFGDKPPWENYQNYWDQSPLKYIGNAKTPTMIIHSEKDFRTTLDQGEHIYVALKKLRVETEMVIFPDENHDLSRSGRTDRRIDRLKNILRWFDKHLK